MRRRRRDAVLRRNSLTARWCRCRLHKKMRATSEVQYPAYGVTGPAGSPAGSKDGSPPAGDRKLAQSAQMYHYQHQKQQMIAAERYIRSRLTIRRRLAAWRSG